MYILFLKAHYISCSELCFPAENWCTDMWNANQTAALNRVWQMFRASEAKTPFFLSYKLLMLSVLCLCLISAFLYLFIARRLGPVRCIVHSYSHFPALACSIVDRSTRVCLQFYQHGMWLWEL